MDVFARLQGTFPSWQPPTESSNPFRQFRLREACFRAGFQDFVQQFEFVREIVVLLANSGAARARALNFSRWLLSLLKHGQGHGNATR